MKIANILLLQTVEMADTFRADGKIYVVVAVLSVITISLLAYLFVLDKKISKLEKEMKK
jgi:Tfp pilus assembly protein PilO